MTGPALRVLCGVLLSAACHVSAEIETLPPYLNQRYVRTPPVNHVPGATGRQLSSPYLSTVKLDWTPYNPFVNPEIFVNPLGVYNGVQSDLFTNIIDQYRTALEVISHRQNVLLKYAECTYGNSDKCPKLPATSEEELKGIHDWSLIYNRPNSDFVRTDNFYEVISAFKSAVEKLTLRQNALYEYTICACGASSECSNALKPFLDILFANNPSVSSEILQNLVLPARGSSSGNIFVDTLTNVFSHIPNISGWIGGYHFNPLNSLLNLNFGSFPFSLFKPTSSPLKPFFSTFTGSKPHSAGVTFSTNPGHQGGSVSTAAVSSSGSDKPSVATVSVSSGESDKPGKPTTEEYTVNNPDGGITHVSTATDGAGGSSIAVSSSSGPTRSKRQYFLPGLGVAAIGQAASTVGLGVAALGAGAANVGLGAAAIGQAAANVGLNAAGIGIAHG